MDIATGKVIGSLRARHRAVEFKRFLSTLDREVPDGLEVHLILDNASTHKTPAIQRSLIAHPRFVLHFTPTSSSWLHLVERWFAELTNTRLRRGTHRSVNQLNADIRAWIDTWNENPRPFVWNQDRRADRRINRSLPANEAMTHDTRPYDRRSRNNARSRGEAACRRLESRTS